MNPAPCTCGEPRPHVVARRQTADGAPLLGWSDGSLAVLGAASGPVALRALALPTTRDVWRALDACEIADAAEACRRVLGPDRPGRSSVSVPGEPCAGLAAWSRPLGRVTDPCAPGAHEWALDDWAAEATDRALALRGRARRRRRS